MEETLKRAHLRPLSYYLFKRRVNFKTYAATRELYKDGDGQPSLVQPFATLWAQYNQLDHESDPELTPDCERNLGEDLSLVAE